ncbi:Hypothetical protein CAP_8121 [Chondromyces apiculatus DSM 436]|uniref:Uncharacterized protein n=1 Tax=Chondromyces apiculatus DSM 436 TaxID=1192034 RepID=A0A017TFM7_9BACT|nr:Hypothetical protein CAP_8121 [Chondromyces apiculatus DSM 436]
MPPYIEEPRIRAAFENAVPARGFLCAPRCFATSLCAGNGGSDHRERRGR